jgi:hypothetical protein
MSAIVEGQEYVSLKDFKTAVLRWAVEKRFEVKTYKADRKRTIYRCKLNDNCPFTISAWWRSDQGKVRLFASLSKST